MQRAARQLHVELVQRGLRRDAHGRRRRRRSATVHRDHPQVVRRALDQPADRRLRRGSTWRRARRRRPVRGGLAEHLVDVRALARRPRELDAGVGDAAGHDARPARRAPAAGGATSTTSSASGTSSSATPPATRRAIWMAPYSWKWVSSIGAGRPARVDPGRDVQEHDSSTPRARSRRGTRGSTPTGRRAACRSRSASAVAAATYSGNETLNFPVAASKLRRDTGVTITGCAPRCVAPSTKVRRYSA